MMAVDGRYHSRMATAKFLYLSNVFWGFGLNDIITIIVPCVTHLYYRIYFSIMTHAYYPD